MMSDNTHLSASRLRRLALCVAAYIFASASLPAFGEEQVLEPLWEYGLTGDSIQALALSPSGGFVAFCDYYRAAVLDSGGTEIWGKGAEDTANTIGIAPRYWKGFWSAAVTSNGLCIFGGNYSWWFVWAFGADGRLLWSKKLHGMPMVMRLSPDETRVAVWAMEGGRLYLLDVENGQGWSSKTPKLSAARSIEFSGDGSRLLVTGAWGGLSVFRSCGGCLWSRRTEGSKGPGYEWQGGSISSDGRIVAVCSRVRKSPRGLLSVYDGRGKQLRARHCLDPWDPCVTPDGELIVTCLRDYDWSQDADAELPEAGTVPAEIIAFTRDGQVAWRAEAGCHRVWMSPDGSLFAAFWPTDGAFALRLFDRWGRLLGDHTMRGKPGQGVTLLTRLRYLAQSLPRFTVWCDDKHIRLFEAPTSNGE